MIGKTILHYKILAKLGEGGMGVVYLAEDTRLERKVAIKFLPRHIAASEEERRRFEIEAKAAAALNHPNIATIHAIEEIDDEMFIVMEYIDGKELRDVLGAAGPIAPTDAINIASQIADGLQAAHEKDIIHRDIKSSNIMITERGQAKIMDFGLAKVHGGSQVTKAGTTLGTIAYMSPEQTQGDEVDQQADIWSFGVVLYEMLTGKLPFKGEYDQAIIYSVINEEPEAPRQLNSDVSPELERIVLKTLAKEKASRYQSISEVKVDLQTLRENRFSPAQPVSGKRFLKRPAVLIPALLLILALGALGFWLINRSAKASWAREEAIPEMMRLIDHEDYTSAFELATEAQKYIPDDPLLKKQWPLLSRTFSIISDPNGAEVFYKQYDNPDGEWIAFGQTPRDSIRFPRGFFRWKFEKPGYQTVIIGESGGRGEIQVKLDKTSEIPENMVRVLGGKARFRLFGLDHITAYSLDDFFIDELEVSNHQYKVFVDSGGYQREEFWQYPFKKDGKSLSWQQAMNEFRDATGRPGPATWEGGTYKEGRGDYPVSGISWFEAAAYAAFAGKELPTIYHWNYAAGTNASVYIAPLSNFENNDLLPVGNSQAIGYYGTSDMAGNVSEWCYNTTGEKHYILGGAWSDPAYTFGHADLKSPFDRSPTNGFRCVKYLSSGKVLEQTKQKISEFPLRDYSREKPVSDETLASFKALYGYSKIPLNSTIEWSDDTHPYWVKEKIQFDTPDGKERMFVYLFLPNNTLPPYQVVTIIPGSRAVYMPSSKEGDNLNSFDMVDFVIKSGRAVLYPVLLSMHERGDGFDFYDPDLQQSDLNEHFFIWFKEFARSIDYLETREDIDISKLAYFGSSWGTWMGAVIVALEPRIKVLVWRLGGLLSNYKPPPFIDPLNFISQIKIPALMLNGRYDYIFPYEKSILPTYRLLGTPEEHKHSVLFDVAHTIPRPRQKMIKETLDWLDKYLGPVEK